MKLLTKEIEKKFEKFPLYSQEDKGLDSEVLVKYFNPYGVGTWLITEAEKLENGDYRLFGYCNIRYWEWGYVLLSDILNTRVNVFGCSLPLERDKFASGTVRELAA